MIARCQQEPPTKSIEFMRGCRVVLTFISRDSQPLQPIRHHNSRRLAQETCTKLESIPNKKQVCKDLRESRILDKVNNSKIVTVEKSQPLKSFATKVQGLLGGSLRHCRFRRSHNAKKECDKTEGFELSEELTPIDHGGKHPQNGGCFRQPSEITMSDFDDSLLSTQWDGDLHYEAKYEKLNSLVDRHKHAHSNIYDKEGSRRNQQHPAVELHWRLLDSCTNGATSNRRAPLRPAVSRTQSGRASLHDKPMQLPQRSLSQRFRDIPLYIPERQISVRNFAC